MWTSDWNKLPNMHQNLHSVRGNEFCSKPEQGTATAFGLGSFRGFLQNQGNLRGPASPLFFLYKKCRPRDPLWVFCLHGSPGGVSRQPPPVPSLGQAITVNINLEQEATKQTRIEPITHWDGLIIAAIRNSWLRQANKANMDFNYSPWGANPCNKLVHWLAWLQLMNHLYNSANW